MLEDYIISNEALDKTEDLFEYETIPEDENKDDAMTKINYHDFLKDIVRPYIYEVAKLETFITYQNFIKLLINSYNKIANICRDSLRLEYSRQKETYLNNFDSFKQFLSTILGTEGFSIKDHDSTNCFVDTFGAVSLIEYESEDFKTDLNFERKPTKNIPQPQSPVKSKNRDLDDYNDEVRNLKNLLII